MAETKKTLAESAQAAIARTILGYVQGGDPDVQLPKILRAVDVLMPNDYLVEQRALFHQVIDDPDNNWMTLLRSLWTDIDPGVREKAIENFLVNASLIGLRRQDAAADRARLQRAVGHARGPHERLQPALHRLLGCRVRRSAEPLVRELDSIVEQGKELGVFF